MSVWYCVQQQEESRWKRYIAIIRAECTITPIGKQAYKVEVPFWENAKYAILQTWQEKRVGRKLIEKLKKEKARLVVATNLKEKLRHTTPWQVQENLKLPAIFSILSYYFQTGNIEKQEVDIAFVCTAFSREAVDIVKQLAQEYRSVQVVTEDVQPYKRLADRVYEENAELITVSNHKKKALRKARWIVNYDASIEQLLEYHMHRESTLFHLQTSMQDMPIGLCRLVVNGMVIQGGDEWEHRLQEMGISSKEFSIEDLVASFLGVESTRREKQAIWETLGLHIQGLQGMHGRIQEQELKKSRNYLQTIDKMQKLH